MVKSISSQLKILKRGVNEILPEGGLKQKLLYSKNNKKPLRIKLGADPTAPDLHLGHLVILRKLKQFQELGHKVVIIIGGFTARIGDPSGRSKVRPSLTEIEIKKNAKTYLDQVGKVLDLKKTEITNNKDWLSKLKLKELLNIFSRFTLNQILAREDFKNRLKNKQEIFFHELLYPLMQGYDSVQVKADIEMGGTDQKFNLLIGRDMQQIFGQHPQAVMTMPLIEGTDGKKKMSKSYGNYIALNDSPEEKYGKIMSLPDDLMLKYFLLLTSISEDQIGKYKRELKTKKTNPRDLKMKLAFEIVKEIDGKEKAKKAQDHFVRIFQKRTIPKDIFAIETTKKDVDLASLLVKNKIVSSKSELRRLIKQKGVKINSKTINTEKIFLLEKENILQIGKRRFYKIIRKQ